MHVRMIALTNFSTSGAVASMSLMSDFGASFWTSMPSPSGTADASFLATSVIRRLSASPSPRP